MEKVAREERMIKLKSCDGQVFDVEEAAALESQLIWQYMQEFRRGGGPAAASDEQQLVMPLAIKSSILAKVVEFSRFHAIEAPACCIINPPHNMPATTLQQYWAADFFDSMPDDTLMSILKAADYLLMERLLDASAAYVARKTKGKIAWEMRRDWSFRKNLSSSEVKHERKDYTHLPRRWQS